MAVFVSAERLRGAVERLAGSRATQRLVDFLILKRAMRRGDTDSVRLSTRDEIFTQSIDDLMKCVPPNRSEDWQGQPLINVFGTGRHGDKGYRSQKYYSNGTAVTVPRWGMMEIVSEGPRVVRLQATYEDGLEDFLLVGSGGPKPRLLDAAVWYFRFHDLEDRFGSTPTEEQLIQGFVQDLGLSDPEVQALFESNEQIPTPAPTVERSEDVSKTIEAIRKGLAETRDWAASAAFASPEDRAQASSGGVELFTRDDYIAVIDRAEEELDRFERGEISGSDLAGFRESIGQVLYYRARSAVSGVKVGGVDVGGKAGVFRGKDGERGERWEPGPRSAGVFSSQVSNLRNV